MTSVSAMPYQDELDAALDAARAAGEVILRAYETFQKIDNPRIDISTEADRQSQETILTMLRHRFPADALCAEEQTPTLADAPRAGRRLWIVDPIDGTRGFASKNGEFSVMIGLAEDSRVVVGVVLEPALGRLTYAVRGGGCWRQDEGGEVVRCHVTATERLEAATLVQSHTRGDKPTRAVRALRPARVVETYSAGVKLARVARGEGDLYVNLYPAFNDWDVCAGHILVEEAGGQVTTLTGEPVRYGETDAGQRGGLLATNGRVHAEAVTRLT